MKVYRARTFGIVMVHGDDGTPRLLPHRLDLMRLSPSGFAWGYQGQGVRQLGLALAADVTGSDEKALASFDHLARTLLMRANRHEPFEMSEVQVRAALLVNAG